MSPVGLECRGTHIIPLMFSCASSNFLNASMSIPDPVKGTGNISMPKSSNNLKCLSKPGTGQINFKFFCSLHGASKPKSWKEIWGSGQGISAVKSIMPAGELVKRINNEYIEAKNKLI